MIRPRGFFQQADVADIRLVCDIEQIADPRDKSAAPLDREIGGHLGLNALSQAMTLGDIERIKPRDNTQCVAHYRNKAQNSLQSESHAGKLELGIQEARQPPGSLEVGFQRGVGELPF